MKNIIITAFILISNLSYSQVAIGKSNIDGHGLLDFGSAAKGIILPIAELNTSSSYTNGTFVMDKTDLIIKVKLNENWLFLSDEGSFDVILNSNNDPISTAVLFNSSDEVGEGVVIGNIDSSGNPPSGAEGVLILESSDKALILPKVENPHTTILSPVAGTICYDTASNSLAVFDGKVWSFWK